jgi:NADH dehydrogenase
MLPEKFAKAVTGELERLDVKVLTNDRASKVTKEGLHTASGQFIPSRMKVWAAGIRCADFFKNLDGLETNRLNQLMVKQTLQTSLDENIFAFGDCACCPQPKNGLPVPPRAQAAHQQAKLLAKSLTRKLKGKSLLTYVYRDYGSLITLSRHTTLGNLMGRITGDLMIQGKIARLVYLSLYKTHQITLYGIWRVMMITIADILTRRVKPRLKLH